ncbi:hypothetical protein R6Q57_026182 [Mikania cordata]
MEETTHFRIGSLFKEIGTDAGSNQVAVGRAEIDEEAFDFKSALVSRPKA